MENVRGDRYAFEHAAVSLWEEDILKLRARLEGLRRDGVDLGTRLEERPSFTQEATALIEVTDVNQATLRLLEADRKETLLGPLRTPLTAVSRAAMNRTLMAIWGGATDVEVESSVTTMGGRPLDVIAKTYIPPAGAACARMLVTLIDITGRKQAEDRERLSANILRSIIESIPDAVMVKDRALKMVLCNANHSRSVGREPEETYGRTDVENGWDEELVKGSPSKGIPGWERDDRAALAGQTVQVKGVPSNVRGQVRFFDVVKLPLRDRSGEVIGIVGIGRDVTDPLRLEKELAWERHLFSTLLDSLPDSIYFKDRESRYLRTSRSHAAERGLRQASEEIGTSDADFLLAEDARRTREAEQRIMESGRAVVDEEEHVIIPGRSDRWFLTTKMPLRDTGGEVAGTFGISHDITRRRLLMERNQQLITLVESSDDAIVGIGMDRRVTVWNRAAERIYGYTAEEMIGSPTSVLIPEELEDEARLIREKLTAGERIEHFETTRRRKDGTRIIVSLTLSAIRDETGQMVGMASVARDVTAQKALQARLAHVQRLESVATLAGGVTHQFNNINTVIKGYLDILRSDPSLSERLRRYVASAADAVNRALDVTDRLLLMTEPAGNPSASVRLDMLARAVTEGFGKLLSVEGVQLVLETAETPSAAGNEQRLRHIITTLITNALDAMLDRPRRVLTVRTHAAPAGASLVVEDTGCGIPPGNLAKVFTPFFSTKGEWAPTGSPQARLKGLGLNLAIASATVSDYGGRIDVSSTEGVGTAFTVVLPAAGGAGPERR